MKNISRESLFGLILNAAIALFGIGLVIYPTIGIKMFKLYVGIALLIVAAVLLFIYMRQEKKNILTLVEAIVSAGFGVVFLATMSIATFVLGAVLMVGVLFDGVINLRVAMLYKKLDVPEWWILGLYSVVAILAGVYLLFNLNIAAKTLVMMTGVFIVIRSVFMISNSLTSEHQYHELNENHNI